MLYTIPESDALSGRLASRGVLPGVEALIFIHKSISAAKLLYRGAVRDIAQAF
jgi:hypothetical protein